MGVLGIYFKKLKWTESSVPAEDLQRDRSERFSTIGTIFLLAPGKRMEVVLEGNA